MNLIFSLANFTQTDAYADAIGVAQRNLYLDGDDWMNGIKWVYDDEYDAKNTPEIWVDESSKAMFIEAEGGVYVNGKLISEEGAW